MAKEEEEGFFGMKISRKAALLFAAALLVLALLATLAAFQLITANRNPPSQPTPSFTVGGIQTTATPVQQNYSVSPLVREYGVDSTPQLVVNCNQLRVGTFASAEESSIAPPGTERQDLINALCGITGKPAFCEKMGEAAVQGQFLPLSKPECLGEGGKVRIYAFHSPTCSKSSSQRRILGTLAAEFPDDVELIYVCTPIFSNDRALCASEVERGTYAE